jgi:hypothetical protein
MQWKVNSQLSGTTNEYVPGSCVHPAGCDDPLVVVAPEPRKAGQMVPEH